jgi:hypothetical protein
VVLLEFLDSAVQFADSPVPQLQFLTEAFLFLFGLIVLFDQMHDLLFEKSKLIGIHQGSPYWYFEILFDYISLAKGVKIYLEAALIAYKTKGINKNQPTGIVRAVHRATGACSRCRLPVRQAAGVHEFLDLTIESVSAHAQEFGSLELVSSASFEYFDNQPLFYFTHY